MSFNNKIKLLIKWNREQYVILGGFLENTLIFIKGADTRILLKRDCSINHINGTLRTIVIKGLLHQLY